MVTSDPGGLQPALLLASLRRCAVLAGPSVPLQDGVNWLSFLNKYKLHGILCDDMGLGKTLQSICILAGDHYLRYRAWC